MTKNTKSNIELHSCSYCKNIANYEYLGNSEEEKHDVNGPNYFCDWHYRLTIKEAQKIGYATPNISYKNKAPNAPEIYFSERYEDGIVVLSKEEELKLQEDFDSYEFNYQAAILIANAVETEKDPKIKADTLQTIIDFNMHEQVKNTVEEIFGTDLKSLISNYKAQHNRSQFKLVK